MKEYRDEEKCVTHFEIRLSAEQIAVLKADALRMGLTADEVARIFARCTPA